MVSCEGIAMEVEVQAGKERQSYCSSLSDVQLQQLSGKTPRTKGTINAHVDMVLFGVGMVLNVRGI
jgi:hypothetical protein